MWGKNKQKWRKKQRDIALDAMMEVMRMSRIRGALHEPRLTEDVSQIKFSFPSSVEEAQKHRRCWLKCAKSEGKEG